MSAYCSGCENLRGHVVLWDSPGFGEGFWEMKGVLYLYFEIPVRRSSCLTNPKSDVGSLKPLDVYIYSRKHDINKRFLAEKCVRGLACTGPSL
jgi:hypothetical protein